MKTADGRASAINADGHLVRRQRQPLLRIVRLSHALVDVGVDRVRSGDGLRRVAGDDDRPSGLCRQLAGAFDERVIGREGFGRGDGDVHAGGGAAEHQRVADVVAVPDVGKLQSLEPTELIVQGQQVAQRLDGVEALA